MGFSPNTDLVATVWLRKITALQATGVGAGTTLPGDLTQWPNGFVQCSAVGGSPDKDIPMRRPAVQIDAWATSTDSNKPPWGRANTLIENVRLATYNNAYIGTTDLPAAFNDARILSVYPVSEPRRVNDDDASFARYTMDLVINWTEITA